MTPEQHAIQDKREPRTRSKNAPWRKIFYTKTRLFGANIDHAILLALCGGLGLLVIPFVRRQRHPFVALMLLVGATLSAAIVLVGLDGATYRARITFDGRAQFEKAWMTATGGIVYVIHPASVPLPPSQGNW